VTPVRRALVLSALLGLLTAGLLGLGAVPAAAAPSGAVLAQTTRTPTNDNNSDVNIDLGDIGNSGKSKGGAQQSVVIIIGMTLLSIAPSLLILMTSFTRIIIVLSITRNAMGLPSIPPNQVVVGLAMFLSLFIMSPTLNAMNAKGIKPFVDGKLSPTQAFEAGSVPLKQFMLKQTRKTELEVFIKASGKPRPKNANNISLAVLAPAFMLSELRTAFIIGFVVFIPFLIIDLLVSAALMSMGLMMLPPTMISLPFKMLLFVMVDGWGLIVQSLVSSFR
jgi:flagellar biosynthetic protein FliP